mmetsp:Transcript_32785/g.48107  ORF Transcript_32785/g.48107 Transcript_32785/m.48107 type:complete len:284 (-) Transcript_32785:271-1122(-)
MQPFGIPAILLATLVASLLAAKGFKRRSLTKSGAVAAFFVGFLSVVCGLRGFLVILFYQAGSSATKYKAEVKETRDATATTDSSRDASQVLGCSIIAVVLSIVHAVTCGEEREIDFHLSPLESKLACGVIAHYATCCADTLASELGILATQNPVLVTNFEKVPPGTNGGVTFSGLLWSAIGGFVIGVGVCVLDFLSGISVGRSITIICFATMCGLIGSFLDSFLGAVFQVTYYDDDKKIVYHESKGSRRHICGMNILSNVQVNVVSVLMTTALGSLVIGPSMF